MGAWRRAAVLLPLVLLLLLAADHATRLAEQRRHVVSYLETPPGSRARFFPALRSFLVQLWLVRIDADLGRGRLGTALRHAREALAFAPDLPVARLRLANVLAYDAAAREADPRARTAWIFEALAILDEGIRRDPDDGLLHSMRGLLLWHRGEFVPDFDEAFRATHGRGTFEAGVDGLLRGAALARGNMDLVLRAAVGAKARADELWLARAKAGETELLSRARDDFETAAELFATMIELSHRPTHAFYRSLEYCRVSADLVALNEARLRGEDVDERAMEALNERRQELRDEN